MATFDSISRLLADALPDCPTLAGEPQLELTPAPSQPARLISATIVEGHSIRAKRIFEPPVVGFAAFLDGTQKSHVERYLPSGAPVVIGTVAAAIRDRRNERLHTWMHVVERRLYLSRSRVSEDVWQRLSGLPIELRNTDDGGADTVDEHPLALRESAYHRVQKDREAAEQALGLAWCKRENRPLLIDGGISNAEQLAHAPCAIGVIKSHRTLYVSGDALTTVLGLDRAERSSVFLVTSPKRASVASWYLRIRDPRGHEPMWGLVRVEVAVPNGAGDEITQRADIVSKWILAESAPVALPDARWDKMVYGVRDCEEFLRAVM
ncbi:MAG TPA: hypothetical protein VGM67_10070 [Gemmatimonadaceae bacterium]